MILSSTLVYYLFSHGSLSDRWYSSLTRPQFCGKIRTVSQMDPSSIFKSPREATIVIIFISIIINTYGNNEILLD